MAINPVPRNEGTLDRIARIVVGVVLLGVAVSGVSPWGWIGVLPLLTGAIGSCPLYTLLGFSTCPLKNRKPATQS